VRSSQRSIKTNSKKLFYGVWLVFGLFQLALIRDSSAANQSILQSSNAAQTDPNAEANSNPSNSSANNSASSTAGTSSGSAPSTPVRISRALFENTTLTSTTQILPPATEVNATPQSLASSIHWDEQQTQAAPVNLIGPTPIASYDNHVGCAEFTNISPLQLCFTIQSDVSSLTLSADQMSLTGLQSVVDTSCITQTKFVSATKNSDNSGFTVQYQMIESSDPRCAGKGGTLYLSIHSSGNSGITSSSTAT
jgi:cytoskeletal protein RodZ